MANEPTKKPPRRFEKPRVATAVHRWSRFRPDPPLFVDAEIEALAGVARPGRARRIREDYQGNPYGAVRLALDRALYAAAGAEQVESQIRSARDDLKAKIEEAEALLQKLRAFAAEAGDLVASARGRRFWRSDQERLQRRVDRMARAREALGAPLDEIVEGLREALADVDAVNSNAKAPVMAFIEVMGFCWRDLTGHDPDNGAQFREFVEAAYATLKIVRPHGPPDGSGQLPFYGLDGSGDPISFAAQIAKVLRRVAARPEADRWDIHERATGETRATIQGNDQ